MSKEIRFSDGSVIEHCILKNLTMSKHKPLTSPKGLRDSRHSGTESMHLQLYDPSSPEHNYSNIIKNMDSEVRDLKANSAT